MSQHPQATEQTSQGIVAAPHYLATRVGTDILQQGGNAFDAAVGVSLAIGVVQPYHSGLGGGANISYRTAAGDSGHINARGSAPAALHRDLFFSSGHADQGKPDYGLVQAGALASTIPSLVAGLWALHKRRGCLPWADVCALPQALAHRGFPVDFMLEHSYHRPGVAAKLAAHAQATLLAQPWQQGQWLRQPQLAETLGYVAKDPRACYTGAIADQLVATLQAAGGVLSAEDLASYQPQHYPLTPLAYRDWQILAPGLPTIGALQTQLALKLLQHYDLAAMVPGSAAQLHLVAEVVRASYRLRAAIDDAASAARIADDAQIAPLLLEISLEHSQAFDTPLPDDASCTSHFCVADAQGNMVSQTQTVRSIFGSGLVDAATGIVLNDSVGDFSLQAGEATTQGIHYRGRYNLLEPQAEPASSQSPLLALHAASGDMLAVGAAGGPRIVSATLQTLMHQIDYAMSPQQAVMMPRVHSHGAVTEVQDARLEPALRALGHQVAVQPTLGIAQSIRRRQGVWQGGADPQAPSSVGVVLANAQGKACACQYYGYSNSHVEAE